jgi:N-hydroxyarylamine O-acetyltransferase
MGGVGETGFDLEAYLGRIGYAGARAATAAVLDAVHLAHASTVPFENLDIHLGRGIRLDLESLQAKLVRDRRGGYCFEQNTLLAAALSALGFAVTPLLARVRMGPHRQTAREHMVLRVEAGGGEYLADVGFGAGGLLRPVPLEAGPVFHQFAWSFCLGREPDVWVLRSLEPGGWLDLYAFTLEPQLPVDFEVSNWYTSTHPNSLFVRTLTAQRTSPSARFTLRNRELTVAREGGSTTRTLGDDELLRVLAETFDIHLPPGTRFACLDGRA